MPGMAILFCSQYILLLQAPAWSVLHFPLWIFPLKLILPIIMYIVFVHGKNSSSYKSSCLSSFLLPGSFLLSGKRQYPDPLFQQSFHNSRNSNLPPFPEPQRCSIHPLLCARLSLVRYTNGLNSTFHQ